MSSVNITPEVLDTLSGNISDIEMRSQQSVADTKTAARNLQGRIGAELAKRKQRVAELTRAYDACLRTEDADCSDLRRQLEVAEARLAAAVRAKGTADSAVSEFNAQSTAAIQNLAQFSVAGKQTLSKLKQKLNDYSSFALLVSPGVLNASYGAAGAISGAFGPSSDATSYGNAPTTDGLSQTNQGYHSAMLGGRAVKVFDHPESSSENAVFNQGAAFPNSTTGTCGLCAVGSILGLAGIQTSERKVTSYAVFHGLCTTNAPTKEFNGGTTGPQLASILQGHGGISASFERGKSLEDLAGSIDQGKGVIIGVRAAALNQPWYDPDNQGVRSAHWIVLQSVVRDAKTNEVVGFYIFDSNGTSPTSTLQYYSSSHLQRAYGLWQSQSVVTSNTIW